MISDALEWAITDFGAACLVLTAADALAARVALVQAIEAEVAAEGKQIAAVARGIVAIGIGVNHNRNTLAMFADKLEDRYGH